MAKIPLKLFLGGGFKYFLFSPLFGKDIQFDEHISDGLKPPISFPFHSGCEKSTTLFFFALLQSEGIG